MCIHVQQEVETNEERTLPCAPVPSSQGDPLPRTHMAMSPYARTDGNTSSVPSTLFGVSALRNACALMHIAFSSTLLHSQVCDG